MPPRLSLPLKPWLLANEHDTQLFSHTSLLSLHAVCLLLGSIVFYEDVSQVFNGRLVVLSTSSRFKILSCTMHSKDSN